MVPGLLLAAQDTLQARGYHGHGHGSAGREWELFFERHTVQAALIGLGISLLAGLLGVGREDTGAEAGQGVLYFVVCAALFIVLPAVMVTYHVQF